jgi:uncharacterized membrane protein YqaE (UPF0057 family)
MGYIKDLDFLKFIFIIILPPAAAYMQVGPAKHFWINLLLTCVGWLPGVIHAIWLVATDKQP